MEQTMTKNQSKIVCVSSTGPDLGDRVDPRFGRCQYIAIIDLDAASAKITVNANLSKGGGVGIATAQFAVNEGADTVVTGQVGPKAEQVLQTAGVRIIAGATGTVRDVIDRYFNKKM